MSASFWEATVTNLPEQKIIKNFEFLGARIIWYLVLLASEITRATWQWADRKVEEKGPGAGKRSYDEMVAMQNPYHQADVAPRAAKRVEVEPPNNMDKIDLNNTIYWKWISQDRLMKTFAHYWNNLQIQSSTSHLTRCLDKQIFCNQPFLQRFRRFMTVIDQNALR